MSHEVLERCGRYGDDRLHHSKLHCLDSVVVVKAKQDIADIEVRP